MTVLKRVHIKYITLLKDVVRCPWSNASRHIPLKNLLGGGVVTKCSGDPSDTLLLHGLITPPSPRLFDKPCSLRVEINVICMPRSAFITSYVCWMFLLVSSLLCTKNFKRETGVKTSWRCAVLIDVNSGIQRPESNKTCDRHLAPTRL